MIYNKYFMKKQQRVFFFCLSLVCFLLGSQTASAVAVSNTDGKTGDNVYDYVLRINRSNMAVVDSNVVVSLKMTALQDVPATQSVVLVPVLEDTTSHRSMELPMVFINSRNQQIYFERTTKYDYPDAIALRKKKGEDLDIDYQRIVPFEPWMSEAVLKLKKQSCACSNMKSRGEEIVAAFGKKEDEPYISLYPVYLLPPADNNLKVREEHGSALIRFELNKWVIKPDYMTNPTELQKIYNSVNLVKSDSDVTIRRMSFEGYASPEGPYAHNVMLSKNRTEALKNYLERTGVTRGIVIEANGRGENWEGLRKEMAKNTYIPQYDRLMAIINSPMGDDEKERRMRSEAPQGYAYILKNIYPGLRCTNYVVNYTVRPFTVEESERVFETKPINLSLNEIYRLADKYANDKPKYNSIMRKASLLYPDDSYINLTMAYLSIKQGNAEGAQEYLNKVNDCPEKTLNQGIISYMKGDLNKAMELVGKAQQAGLAEAANQMKELEKLKLYKEKYGNTENAGNAGNAGTTGNNENK
jgi:outer membrane protein OmpA-like peptidoglycan-associated protein